MKYISKGCVVKGSTGQFLTVRRCGVDFRLTGASAQLWIAGRYGFKTASEQQATDLSLLRRMQLVECSEDADGLAGYRMLTNCIIVPAKLRPLRQPIGEDEKMLWTWISGAGLRLTMAELVFLTEHRVLPAPAYLGAGNRQALVERIYTCDNIADNLLETAMESAACRDNTVNTVCALLRKKRILLI